MPRKRANRDRWPQLCELVAIDDGLPVRSAGQWTKDKLFFWNRYLEITTSAMVGSRHWAAVVYVDLFAGPGVLQLRDSGQRIPGSVVLAANTPKPFDRLLVCEKDQDIAAACEARLKASGVANRSSVFVGDCNERISDLVREIPDRSLTLAFVDPEGLHVHFDTLLALARDRRVDLLILLADKMDAVRNIARYYNRESPNLDRFLGDQCDWRSAYDQLPRLDDSAAVCLLLEGLLRDQMERRLGYRAFGGEVMRSSKTAIYRVVYASKSDKGLEFWNKIAKIDSQHQQGLDFF